MKQITAWQTEDGILYADVSLAEAHESQASLEHLGAATAQNVAEALANAHAGAEPAPLEKAIIAIASLFWSARNKRPEPSTTISAAQG